MATNFAVRNLIKKYGSKTILHNISFEIPFGSITVLFGSSGAGKTTLLRCLAAIEPFDEGTIYLAGKRVGIVFQQFHLWQHMTLLDNLITAPIQVLKMSKNQAIAEAKDLLTQLNILDKCLQYPKALSGGEQQRAAIARALMMKPDIMLFDEPTSSLDPKRTQSIAEIMKTLANKGMTLIVATHDVQFVKHAELAIFLDRGEILEMTRIQDQTISPKHPLFLQFLNQTEIN